MRRGEIWTAAGKGTYGSKPRPVLIIQADEMPTVDSLTILPLTSDETDAPLIRVPVPEDLGLSKSSRIMIDKIQTIRRTDLGERIGALPHDALLRVERSLLVFLGIA